MRQRLVRGLLHSVAIVGLLLVCAGSSWSQDREKLFKSKCVACHGPDGKGDTPTGKKLGARDLTSTEVQSQSDAQLIEIVAKGKGKMPAYGKTLKDDEIKDLVAYVRGLAKKT